MENLNEFVRGLVALRAHKELIQAGLKVHGSEFETMIILRSEVDRHMRVLGRKLADMAFNEDNTLDLDAKDAPGSTQGKEEVP